MILHISLAGLSMLVPPRNTAKWFPNLMARFCVLNLAAMVFASGADKQQKL